MSDVTKMSGVLGCGLGAAAFSMFGLPGLVGGCVIGVMAVGCGKEEDAAGTPEEGDIEQLNIQTKNEQNQVIANTANGHNHAIMNATCNNVGDAIEAKVEFIVITSQPDATVSIYSDAQSLNPDRRNCIPVRERGTQYCKIFESTITSTNHGSLSFQWAIDQRTTGFGVRAEQGVLQSNIIYLDVQNRCPSR